MSSYGRPWTAMNTLRGERMKKRFEAELRKAEILLLGIDDEIERRFPGVRAELKQKIHTLQIIVEIEGSHKALTFKPST